MLEDLIIWTNYEIEVAAYNGAGRGIYSHKVTEWTLQGGERHAVGKNAPTRYASQSQGQEDTGHDSHPHHQHRGITDLLSHEANGPQIGTCVDLS